MEVHLIRLSPSKQNRPLCFIESGRLLLRCFNSLCHLETLFPNSLNSRSQAWRFRSRRSLCMLLLNSWVRSGRFGRHNGIWDDNSTRSQNQGMLGQPGAMMINLWQRRTLFTTFVRRGIGGNTYRSRFYKDRLRASRAFASGTGDTVCFCTWWQTCLSLGGATCGRSEQTQAGAATIPSGLPAGVWTLNCVSHWAGAECGVLSGKFFPRLHQYRSLHRKAQTPSACLLLRLCMPPQ